jgi:hypothetical protein
MAVEENGSGQPGPAQTKGNNVQADKNIQHPLVPGLARQF